MDLVRHYLDTALFELHRMKKLAEDAFEQVDDEDLHRDIDEESNSIAVLVQHLSGNFVSRWTDFLTSDGEKPDRHRDREFEAGSTTRAELTAIWARGWSQALETLAGLTPSDLDRTVRIRGEEHTVPEAIQRQIVHTSYHVGQIVLLAKHFQAADWNNLSIPKGAAESAPGRYRKR
jgi:uncharacterized damage-inducible protein DinB